MQPWSVVLVGRPNIGKSTLMNALLGFTRSIVYGEPGTTRDVVTAQTAFDGWPVELSDTAGIREPADAIEAAGIDRTWNRLESADLRLLLIDASQGPTSEDRGLLSRYPNALCVGHKSDLVQSGDTYSQLPPGAIAVSSLTGDGIDLLMDRIVQLLVPFVPDPCTAFPVTERLQSRLETAHAACCDCRPNDLLELLQRFL